MWPLNKANLAADAYRTVLNQLDPGFIYDVQFLIENLVIEHAGTQNTANTIAVNSTFVTKTDVISAEYPRAGTDHFGERGLAKASRVSDLQPQTASLNQGIPRRTVLVAEAVRRLSGRYARGDGMGEGGPGMLDQALIALAASGGTALVSAAGTDAWTGLRQAVAHWFGRGDAHREQAELDRLDQTAACVQASDPGEAERTRNRQEVVWQTRMETLLESLDAAERERAAEQLRSLLAHHAPQSGVMAGAGGLAANTVDIHADHGSIAGGVIHGGAHIGPPSLPDPPQG
ncbi:hypothetical protein ACFQ7F_16200 [Streptomyces sp. NPDC056486]|uniref:hypothetical protein n=1 Tax=Streptomyces sp. NPDC056486 TaxID=3345835 RepID=UPI00367743F7